MSKQMAIFVDDSGTIATPDESISINVYAKQENQWKVLKRIPFSMTESNDIQAFRDKHLNVINTLEDCKIIVGKEVVGITFTVFERAGYQIIEADGIPEQVLDEILNVIEEHESTFLLNAQEFITGVEPIAIDNEGRFSLNLKELLATNSKITSKQALLPFLKNKSFYELQVICGHVPPWLEKELNNLNMRKIVEQISESEFKVTISQKCCC